VSEPNLIGIDLNSKEVSHRIGAKVFRIDGANSDFNYAPERFTRALRRAATEWGSN
jgi:hypothetical protein